MSDHTGCAKIIYKTQGFFKKSTLANTGRLDNKRFVKFGKRKIFFLALLHKRFLSKKSMLDGQIMFRGWGSEV